MNCFSGSCCVSRLHQPKAGPCLHVSTWRCRLDVVGISMWMYQILRHLISLALLSWQLWFILDVSITVSVLTAPLEYLLCNWMSCNGESRLNLWGWACFLWWQESSDCGFAGWMPWWMEKSRQAFWILVPNCHWIKLLTFRILTWFRARFGGRKLCDGGPLTWVVMFIIESEDVCIHDQIEENCANNVYRVKNTWFDVFVIMITNDD